MVHMFAAIVCVALVCSTGSAAQLGPPGNLRVEGLLPEVAFLSEPKPQFSFVPPNSPPGEFNTTQLTYRITVSHTGAATPIWDSGNVASQATLVEVPRPLPSPSHAPPPPPPPTTNTHDWPTAPNARGQHH